MNKKANFAFASSAAITLRPTFASTSLSNIRVRVTDGFARRPHHVRMVAEESNKAKDGRKDKVAQFTKLYGGSYLGTSIALSIVSYVVWYFLIQAGVDVVALIQVLGDWLSTTPIGRPAILSRINETVGTATLAYIAHKATSPIRFPITLAATPFVARTFSRKDTKK